MSERHASPQALAMKRPATHHFRCGGRLVDEDEPMRLLTHPRLTMQPPSSPCLADIIASALQCQ